MSTWSKDLQTALRNLGEKSYPLNKILDEAFKIKKKRDPSWQPTTRWRATCRKELERHSSDSELWKSKYKGKEDLFYSAKGIGKGVWGLRNAEIKKNRGWSMKGDGKVVYKSFDYSLFAHEGTGIPKDYFRSFFQEEGNIVIKVGGKDFECKIVPSRDKYSTSSGGRWRLWIKDEFHNYLLKEFPEFAHMSKKEWTLFRQHGNKKYPRLCLRKEGIRKYAASIEKDDDYTPATDEVGEGGQGYNLSPEEKKAVEEYAMEQVEKIWTAKGWKVKDVHKNKKVGCDFICSKGTQSVYCEVKGTQRGPSKVILTRQEVERMKARYPDTALYVIYGIKLDKSQDPPIAITTSGKVKKKFPWKIENHKLRVINYEYKT